MAGEMRGIFTIPQTPYVKGREGYLELDEESLRREINFCVEAGAHGIVMPVMASEFSLLCEDERKRIAEIVVEETRRRIPTVIGVAGANTRLAVRLAVHAQEVGADAVIAMPPYISHLGRDEVYEYYKAISDAINITIFIQNHPIAGALPPEFVAKLVKEIRNVKYVKEECPPEAHSISAVLKACGSDVKGVFGGAGGRWLIEELKRGAAGNMPGCVYTDILSEIFNRFSRGDEDGARELHRDYLVLTNTTAGGGKEVLVLRGIIRASYSRGPYTALDEYDWAELRRNLKLLGKHFKVYPPRL